MTVTDLEGLCDGLLDLSRLGLPGAESDLGDLDAVVTGWRLTQWKLWKLWRTRGHWAMHVSAPLGKRRSVLASAGPQVGTAGGGCTRHTQLSKLATCCPPPPRFNHGSRKTPSHSVHSQSKLALVRHGCVCCCVCGRVRWQLWEPIYRCDGGLGLHC